MFIRVGKIGETVMQTPDAVESLHNFPEFS